VILASLFFFLGFFFFFLEGAVVFSSSVPSSTIASSVSGEAKRRKNQREGLGDINEIRLVPFFGLACVGSFDGARNLGSLLKRRPDAKEVITQS